MAIYECTIRGEKRFVNATEEDGQFRSDDIRPGAARTTQGYVYTFAGSLEELVAKGIRSYPTAAGARSASPEAFKRHDEEARRQRIAMGPAFMHPGDAE